MKPGCGGGGAASKPRKQAKAPIVRKPAMPSGWGTPKVKMNFIKKK